MTLAFGFIARPGFDLPAEVAAFSAEHGVKEKKVQGLARATIVFLQGCLAANVSEANIAGELAKVGVTAQAALIGKLWKFQSSAAMRATQGRTLEFNSIVDMEWKFGVTAATDELERAGGTFLQLKLTLDKGGGVQDTEYIELSLPQFYEFLHEMERANATMQQFS